MHLHSKYTSTYSSIPGTYSSIQDMYQFWYCCVQPIRATAGKRRRASDVYTPQYSLYVPGAALLLLLSALYVDFLSLPISVGIAGAPPWAVSAPDLAVGT